MIGLDLFLRKKGGEVAFKLADGLGESMSLLCGFGQNCQQ